jgi:hypothetical protein
MILVMKEDELNHINYINLMPVAAWGRLPDRLLNITPLPNLRSQLFRGPSCE